MAKTSSFGFTNTTDGSNSVTQKALGLTTSYATTEQEANQVKLSNVTAPVDQEEIITIKSRVVDKIPTYLNNQYPGKVQTGIEYSVRVDDMLSTTDSADPDFRVDEPIVCSIAIRHPRSGNITSSQVATVFVRALSCLMKADGTWRFDDLMRRAEKPTAN